MCRVIAISNIKGGIGKTATSVSVSVGIANKGKKVLLIDLDPQGSATISLGYDAKNLTYTMYDVIADLLDPKKQLTGEEGVLHNQEGVDLMPANYTLSGAENLNSNSTEKFFLLSDYVELVRDKYDYIIIDCMTALGVLTMNALICADSVLIPAEAKHLGIEGIQELLRNIQNIKKRHNPTLAIEGILITMYDSRTNLSKGIHELVKNSYGNNIKIFNSVIPHSVRMAETTIEGVSIYKYEPKGNAACKYLELVEEVLNNESECF